ncbi:MAG: T9SS type A sorting domain-containing protein [Paludibacter sp.]|nr:T9SS type A sorting domain-containing protein [Paludibacter sp.]
MRKITFLVLFFVLSTILTFSAETWQKLDLTKAGGGTISTDIYNISLDGGKLYVATGDGIWLSPSANGGDFEPFGLQGIIVTHLSLKVAKLAVVNITATDDVTKKCTKIYKLVGANWVITNFNPQSLSTFGSPSASFAQIQDGANNTVIVVPTWGNGIWRSTDGGANFTQYAFSTNAHGDVYKAVTGIWAYGNTLYGTDKTVYNNQYLIKSTDFGATWSNTLAGNYSTPRAFHKRKVGAVDYTYIAGDFENGGIGSLNYSDDDFANWSSSYSVGSDFWYVNRIIGDDNGPLYIACSKTNVMVSNDNGDSFAPLATGIDIIASPPKNYLNDLVKSATKLYVSTRSVNGIYYYNLTASGLNQITEQAKICYPSITSKEIFVNATVGSKISILNLDGKTVKSLVAQTEKTSINVQSLNSAIYIVKTQNLNAKQVVDKFIKK